LPAAAAIDLAGHGRAGVLRPGATHLDAVVARLGDSFNAQLLRELFGNVRGDPADLVLDPAVIAAIVCL